ncbi:MAG: hypothetical protein CM15mP98_13250 [Paracoccaceae bacterium]|nr:MAG: hypothetical protein CM15mP98_13250 [Paracoccaceae bacterium]
MLLAEAFRCLKNIEDIEVVSVMGPNRDKIAALQMSGT